MPGRKIALQEGWKYLEDKDHMKESRVLRRIFQESNFYKK